MDDDLRKILEMLDERLERLEKRMDAVEEELGVGRQEVAKEDQEREESEATPVDEGFGDEAEEREESGEEAEAKTEDEDVLYEDIGVETEGEGEREKKIDVGGKKGEDEETVYAEIGSASEPEEVETENILEKKGGSFELDVGVKWFGRVGALAVALGVVLFFNYAIEQGWIGPLARIALGVGAGISLVGVGEFSSRDGGIGSGVIDDTEFWSATVKGLGIAVTYFSVYASYGFESYRTALGTPLSVAVVGMTVVVAGGIGLALRDGSRPLSYEAFFLGYVTAFISVEVGVASVVYVVLLSVGVGVVVHKKGWGWLSAGGVVGGYTVYMAGGYGGSSSVLATAFLAAVFVVFLVQSFIVDEEDVPKLVTVVNSVAFGFLSVPLMREHEAALDLPVTGVFLGVFAALHAGLYAATESRDMSVSRVYPYLGVLFLVSALWELLSPSGFTIAVALLAPVLFVVSEAAEVPEVRRSGHVVAGTAVLSALWFSEEISTFETGEPVSSYLFVFGFVTVSLYAVYALGQRMEEGLVEDEDRASYVYSGAAAVFGSSLVLLEGGDFFSTPVLVAYSLALLYAGLSTDAVDLRAEAYSVTALSVGKLLFVDTDGFSGFEVAEPLARSRLPLFVVAVVGLYAGYVLLRDAGLTGAETNADYGYSGVAAVVGSALIVLEGGDLFSTPLLFVYGLALLYAGLSSDSVDLRVEGYTVTAAAIGKLVFVDIDQLPGFNAADPLSPSTLPVFVVGAVCLYVAYIVLSDARLSENEEYVPFGYSGAAAFVILLGFAVELSGLGISAGWAAYGLTLVALGIRSGAKDLRLEAIAVLGLASIKVFIIDTRGLSSGARILSYITLGVILLAASFAYARYSDKISETL